MNNLHKFLLPGVITLILVLSGTHAIAGDSPLNVNLESFLQNELDNSLRKIDAETPVKPGEVIVYRATYRNLGPSTLSGIAATLPVPTGTVAVLDIDSPVSPMASVNGRTFHSTPLVRTLPNTGEQEVIPAEEYVAMRWPVASLPAGESFTAEIRVRVTEE